MMMLFHCLTWAVMLFILQATVSTLEHASMQTEIDQGQLTNDIGNKRVAENATPEQMKPTEKVGVADGTMIQEQKTNGDWAVKRKESQATLKELQQRETELDCMLEQEIRQKDARILELETMITMLEQDLRQIDAKIQQMGC